MQDKNRIIAIIFIIAMLLRLFLGIYNREANDNHVEVVSWIVDKHQIPEAKDCWSCYQPKLFYLFCSGIVIPFQINNTEGRIVTMQLINVCFSFFILLLFWKFIEKQSLSSQNKILLFAFFAFNPCLCGINVQSTNDTLVILAGISTVYFADAFFSEMKWKDGVLLIVAVIAAALTKGTGMILWIVISAVFLIKVFYQNSKAVKFRLAKYFSVLLISYLLIVPYFGGYITNYIKYNSLTLSTWQKNSPPLFFQFTPVERPGVQSVFEGFFTFRYFDMIRQPYINNEPDNYPLHRTSLWSQLYGRTAFMHFDQCPPSWQTHDTFIMIIGRILIMLGIVPLFMFLKGLIPGTFQFLKKFVRGNRQYMISSNDYLHLGIAVAFLLSSVMYSYNYRDFSSMKSIYIFPGFISYIKLSSNGLISLKSRIPLKIVQCILMAMAVFSTIDIIFLIWQLK